MASRLLTARALDGLLGDWRGRGPGYRALADRIRLLILDGRIPIDTRMPAERDLAARLGLSRTTITAAYRALRDDGYASSRQGSGTLSCLPGTEPLAHISADAGGLLDFSKAAMPASALIAEAAQHAAALLPRHMNGPGYDPVGMIELREAIAERYRARGLPTDPAQIMVTVGAQHAISLLARVIVGRGDRALIEQPTYPHASEAIRAAGARLVPANVDPDGGWDDAQLLQGIERSNPSLAYLMPDFHNPTGRSMPDEQRERLVTAAARQGTVLVADETTAELDIDRGDADAAAGRSDDYLPLAAHGGRRSADATVLVGSVGKTVWGGLRIGWIRAETPLIRRLVGARSIGDLGTPILEQLVVARLVENWGAVLEQRRMVLSEGRDRLETLLAARFPQWHVPHVTGGLATWISLGEPISSQLALAARSEGLLIAAGPRFGFDGAFERHLRLPICYPGDETSQAVDALERALAAVQRHPLVDTGYLADVV